MHESLERVVIKIVKFKNVEVGQLFDPLDHPLRVGDGLYDACYVREEDRVWIENEDDALLGPERADIRDFHPDQPCEVLVYRSPR